jgi:hemoglobin/transferrin/lactoferrin receptor protein
MKKLCLRKSLTALISTIIATSAFADSQSNKTFSLDTVSVAATRTEQKQEDLSSTVSIITDEQNEANLASNIREMIRYEPGVEVGSGTGDSARFGSKGFNIRGIDENRVKITVDGVDQASSFTPTGNPFQRSGRNHIDIDTMKRVEIIKGPASTLYGSDALGGVVAFTTKDPADYLEEGDNTGGSVKLRYSSADEAFSETVSLANRTGSLESLVIYTHRDGEELENYDEDAIGDDSLDFKSDNILAKLQYQLNEQHRIGLTMEDYQSDTEHDIPSKLSSPFYSDYYEGDDTIERQRVSIFHQWQAKNVLFDKVNWNLDWQDSEIEQETSSIYNPGGPRARVKDYSHDEEIWMLSAQFDKTVQNHQLTYGFEYEETELTNQQDTLYPTDTSSNIYDRAVPLVDGTSYGVYLQDQISFVDGRVLITPGIRYDRFKAEPSSDDAFNPPSATTQDLSDHDSDKVTLHLGGVFKITEVTSVFAQYSEGFKSPDLIDLYYSTERNYGPGNHFLTRPNPDLKPEESDSIEFGLRFNGDLGNLELTSFHNQYQDFIESVSVSPSFGGVGYDGVTQSRNIDEVSISGFEARGAVWLDQLIGAPEGTSFQGSIAYAEGDNDTDDTPLDSIAPLKAVFGLSYDAPSEVWGSTLHWTLVKAKDKSDISDDTNFTTSGYGILDMTAYYNPVKSLTIRGGVFNITDKEYTIYEDVRELSASNTNLDLYTQPGRNFSVSATYNF